MSQTKIGGHGQTRYNLHLPVTNKKLKATSTSPPPFPDGPDIKYSRSILHILNSGIQTYTTKLLIMNSIYFYCIVCPPGLPALPHTLKDTYMLRSIYLVRPTHIQKTYWVPGTHTYMLHEVCDIRAYMLNRRVFFPVPSIKSSKYHHFCVNNDSNNNMNTAIQSSTEINHLWFPYIR